VFFCGVGRLWLYFVDTCTNKSDCSGGLRDSRTDCLLFIEALGSTRSCGQHGYLAATHHPPWWRIIRVHSNPIRIRFADTVLDSIRIRLVFARMDSRYLDSCPTLRLDLITAVRPVQTAVLDGLCRTLSAGGSAIEKLFLRQLCKIPPAGIIICRIPPKIASFDHTPTKKRPK
jgi:hypothetical protein